jgi:hypothetical protein
MAETSAAMNAAAAANAAAAMKAGTFGILFGGGGSGSLC